jgi:hypothetical protein
MLVCLSQLLLEHPPFRQHLALRLAPLSRPKLRKIKVVFSPHDSQNLSLTYPFLKQNSAIFISPTRRIGQRWGATRAPRRGDIR